MPPAKAQRRQVRKRCHFDRREKSFLDPSHSLGMTGMGSSPLRLGAFAGDNSAFGCAVRQQGEPLFSSAVWGKACITMLENLRTTRKLMTTHNISDSEIPPAKARRAPSSDNYFLCGLCVFAGDISDFFWLRRSRAGFFATSLENRKGGGPLVSLGTTPRFRHSSMECWNPGRHGCLRTHPAHLDAGHPCRHDEALHFHSLWASVRS